MMQKLDALDMQLTATLKGSQDKEYVVFHDAYQYFEKSSLKTHQQPFQQLTL